MTSSEQHVTSTITTASVTMLLKLLMVVLSLYMTSSVAAASQDATDASVPARPGTTAILLGTRQDGAPTNSTSSPVGTAALPSAANRRPSAEQTTTVRAPSSATLRRDIYIRGHLLQNGGQVRPEVEESADSDNKTRDSRDDDDWSRLRRFHLISAAQSSSGGSGGGLGQLGRRQPVGPSVTTRLLYGAIALVLASILTPLVCLAAGLVRSRIAKCLERRRRYDKSGEYERVGSVSSVVDSSIYAGSQSQLDVYVDDPFTIEDVTII